MDGVVPRTREEFEKQCANVLSMTLIYFPHHPGYTSAERMSLGEMIVRHRFVWPWTFGHSFRVIQVFMRNHPQCAVCAGVERGGYDAAGHAAAHARSGG